MLPFKKPPANKLGTTNQINRLADAVDSAMIGGGESGGIPWGNRALIFSAKILGVQDSRRGWYDASPMEAPPTPAKGATTALGTNDYGTNSSTASLTVWNPAEISGGATIATGSIVPVRVLGTDADGQTLCETLGGAGGNGNYWRLTQVGGVAGTNNATCSFTYNVFAFSDTGKTVSIATSVALTGNTRLPNVTYTAAGYGSGVVTGENLGTNNPSGVVLLWVDELPATTACT